jgi:hypothetical protein
MQGAFPAGADWASALQPGNDERVERMARSDIVERQLHNLARRQPGAAPAPLAPNLDYEGGPYPPAAHFRADGETYYILSELAMRNVPSRPGTLGHYLVPVVAVRNRHRQMRCRPFINPQRLPRYVPPLADAPGMLQGDTRPRPHDKYCLAGRDYTTPSLAPYREIGLAVLQDVLERAEALDMAFARRMEGLGNVAAQAWLWILPVASPPPVLNPPFCSPSGLLGVPGPRL